MYLWYQDNEAVAEAAGIRLQRLIIISAFAEALEMLPIMKYAKFAEGYKTYLIRPFCMRGLDSRQWRTPFVRSSTHHLCVVIEEQPG